MASITDPPSRATTTNNAPTRTTLTQRPSHSTNSAQQSHFWTGLCTPPSETCCFSISCCSVTRWSTAGAADLPGETGPLRAPAGWTCEPNPSATWPFFGPGIAHRPAGDNSKILVGAIIGVLIPVGVLVFFCCFILNRKRHRREAAQIYALRPMAGSDGAARGQAGLPERRVPGEGVRVVEDPPPPYVHAPAYKPEDDSRWS